MIIFGEKEANISYTWRPGVYGIVFNEKKDQIALIQTEDGKYFLPGGGLENGESHSECLLREGIEEMGMVLELGDFIGSAQRYFFSTKDRKHYLVEGHFYSGKIKGRAGDPTEPGHFLRWTATEEAVARLFQEHQSWAVERALMMGKNVTSS
ncbi:NUDIX hydrolase [Mesobacillus subterraneus]|uniref:NUDIX domain-containing protein n=1 Tax=Mesobacillus subterraneus TaxID=285983 RepID=A0A3R9EWW1_9BACI|nr:NUDIX domain-containing protein [Mesobacillus subterraneus]RSD23030.1 NUDIX domain-containing protein [Mesobacillus subterraneus]